MGVQNTGRWQFLPVLGLTMLRKEKLTIRIVSIMPVMYDISNEKVHCV